MIKRKIILLFVLFSCGLFVNSTSGLGTEEFGDRSIEISCEWYDGVAAVAKSLHWTWTSHIDLKATIHKFVAQEPKIADMVVIRDSNKLYQNGIAIADITGTVQINDDTVLFTQIANVSGLDKSQPIEYRRFKLKVTQVQTTIGMKTVVSDKGSSVLQNVMEGVTCEELK